MQAHNRVLSQQQVLDGTTPPTPYDLTLSHGTTLTAHSKENGRFFTINSTSKIQHQPHLAGAVPEHFGSQRIVMDRNYYNKFYPVLKTHGSRFGSSKRTSATSGQFRQYTNPSPQSTLYENKRR